LLIFKHLRVSNASSCERPVKSGIAVTGEADLHCEDLKFARLDLGGNMRDAFSHLCDITAKNFADFAELRKEHVVAAGLYLAEIIFIQPAFCR
jgi:hypothetical protein